MQFPRATPRKTDMLQPKHVVGDVVGELASWLHPGYKTPLKIASLSQKCGPQG